MATGPETVGTIGLAGSTKYSRAGEVEVQPMVGAAHLKVESIVAELRGEPKKRHVPATVNRPPYMLIDPTVYRNWFFAPSVAHTFAYRLGEALEEYAIPYMRRLNSIEAIRAELDVNSGPEKYRHACRLAVVLQLLGDADGARAVIDAELRQIGSRSDLAIDVFRTFAREFARRFGSPSGP